MKKTRNLLLTASAVAATTMTLPGAVTTFGDYTKTTDGNESFSTIFGGGSEIFFYDSGDIYLTVDILFNPDNSPLDTTESYGGISANLPASDLFGQNWQQSTVGVEYYGGRNDIAGVGISPNTVITLVMKWELNGVGDDPNLDTMAFWVNPTLGDGIEDTPDDYNAANIWGPQTVSSNNVGFRRGNGSDNTIVFSNIRLYDGGDSPFDLVPEPSTALLGGLGLLALLRRRR